MMIPQEPGLYWAFVGDRTEGDPSNAIVEVFGESPFLGARVHTLANCSHPLLPTGTTIDRNDEHITIGQRISDACR